MSQPCFAVTGASGFIGRALVLELRRRFPESVILASGRDPSRLNELAARAGAVALPGDLAEIARHASSLSEATHFFHGGCTAAFADGEVFRRDLENTRRVVALLQSSSRLRRFVYVSSIAATDRHPEDALERPLHEDSAPAPTTDYGRSKLECEHLTRGSGLPYLIVRPAWVYGPGMRLDSHVRAFIQAVGRSAPYTLFDLPGRVSLIYVDDMARALAHLGTEPGLEGGTFMAAGDDPVRLGDLFAAIDRHYYGRTRSRLPLPALLSRAAAAARRWLPLQVQVILTDALACSNRRLREAGFREQVALDEGLRRMRANAGADAMVSSAATET